MKHLSVAALILGTAFVLSDICGVSAAKLLNYTPASVAFRDDGVDGSMDRIMSDGFGPYVDGVSGSVCRIYTGGSQDLTVGTYKSGRKVRYFYAPAGDLPQPTLTPPSGSLVDNSFFTIKNIGAMPVGTVKATQAQFNTAIGLFRWSALDGSLLVYVVRNSKTSWTVSTDPFVAGAGDIGVLMKAFRNTYKPAGLYHLPFGLEVTCPACP